MNFGSAMQSSWLQLKPDPEKKPNAQVRHMLLQWLQTTTRSPKFMPSARVRISAGNPQGSTNHSRLARTTSNGRKTNLGNQAAKVTIPTGMDRHAASARCRTTDRRTAAKESRPTSLAWTPTDTRSGQRSMLLTKIQPIPSRPWISPSRIFSDELDGTPMSSSPYHSSIDIESLCHLHCDIQ